MTRNTWRLVYDLVSIATVLGGIGALILSLMGIVSESVVLPSILALLVLLATSEIVERRMLLDAILKKVSPLGDPKTDVKVFDHVDDHYKFLKERISCANRYVDIVNFRPEQPRPTVERIKYAKAFDKRIATGALRVRRIVIPYDLTTLTWIADLLHRHNGCNFWVAHYERPAEYLPVLNMLLIDGHEVFVGGFFKTGQYDENGTIWLRDSRISQAFQDYYDYLWHKAHPLNSGSVIDEGTLKRLERELNQETVERV